MKRLRDIEQPSALEAKAQALVDAVEPVDTSHARMLRIRHSLEHEHKHERAVPLWRRLPALALAGLVVMFGASAFAAVRLYVASVAPSDEAPRLEARAHAPKPVQRPAPETLEQIEEVETQLAPRPQPRVRSKAQTAQQAELAADSELIHRAVKALRRDGDPALAKRLLEADRARAAKGPLAEEALSLRIEAAIALEDPGARRLAREYLSRYPSGRYKSIARRALRGPREVAGE